MLSSIVSIEQPPTHNHKHLRSLEGDVNISTPSAKKQAMSRPIAKLVTAVGDDLGEYVRCDEELFKVKGWSRLVQELKGCRDVSELNIDHPA